MIHISLKQSTWNLISIHFMFVSPHRSRYLNFMTISICKWHTAMWYIRNEYRQVRAWNVHQDNNSSTPIMIAHSMFQQMAIALLASRHYLLVMSPVRNHKDTNICTEHDHPHRITDVQFENLSVIRCLWNLYRSHIKMCDQYEWWWANTRQFWNGCVWFHHFNKL